MTMIATRHGQAALETNLLLGVAITAFVGMTLYVQRAYQGYLYSNASSQGVAFDPTADFAICQDLDMTQKQKIDMAKGKAALNLFAVRGGTPWSGGVDLSNRSQGPGPLLGRVGRIRGVKAEVKTEWKVKAKSRFDGGLC
jgi:hypothetical protein